MGKLVPNKSPHISTIPSFETDVHKLIDKFVLKVERIDETKFSTFKEIWRESSFSFIHQAVPLNIPAGDFLQLLYAVALNRLVDPSPYLNYRADPGELTGTACCNATPAEAEDALVQLAGEADVGTHRGVGASSGAGVEQISLRQGAAPGAPAGAPINTLRSNSDAGRNLGAAGLAAAEEDPLDQECDLLAHLDELCSDLFQEHQVQHHTEQGQPFSMSSHVQALPYSLNGAAGKNTTGGFSNVALAGPPLPSQFLTRPQQHVTAACLNAGPHGALHGFQERPTCNPPLAGPELSLLLAMTPGSPSHSQREQQHDQQLQQLQQQQQQQCRGAEDSYAWCDTLMGSNAEGRELQQRGQDAAPCTQLLPSALTVACANGSLDAAFEPGPISHGLAEEDDYDDALMDGVPDKPSVLLSSTWGTAHPATSQAADSAPRNVPNLKVQCKEPADGNMPGPQHTVDCVEEAPDKLMPMNGSSDLQVPPAAAGSGRTPEAVMGPVCAELAPLTASPGGCSIAVMDGSPGGLSVDLVGMDLAPHSSGPFKGPFSPMRSSSGVSPSPLKGLAFPTSTQATPDVSPPTPSSLKGSPALRTLRTPIQLQSPQPRVRAPDGANAALATPYAAEPGDSAATQLHTVVAAAADAFAFVAPTITRIEGAVAKGPAASGIHSPEPHAMLADAQSLGWAAQGLPPPPPQQHQQQQQQQQQQQPALPWLMQAPCGGNPTQPISDLGTAAAILTLAAAEGSARANDVGCNRIVDGTGWEALAPTRAVTSGTPGADVGAIEPIGAPDDAACGAPGPIDEGLPPVPGSMRARETTNSNLNLQQQPTLPAEPPLPGPDVPLAARVGAIYALYCLHATQICCPSVRIYVPLPLMTSLTGTVREAVAAGLRDVLAIVRKLWRQGALVPGGVARFPGATSALPSVGSYGWKAATAARAQAIAAGHGGIHKHLDASHRRLATFHEVLMSNPILRQALLHLRTALPLLADMEAFERLCDLYGKQRSAVFHENNNGGDGGASCTAAPDVLFEARVGGEVRRTVRRMFAEVLRALRLPPPRVQRTERKRRERELGAQREAEEAEARLEAAVASPPCTVAEALAQVAVKPPALQRRRVAGELGALMRRRAIQGGRERTAGPGAATGSIGGGGGCIGPTDSGRRQQQRTTITVRHRSELASAGLLGEDGLRAAAMPGIPPRVLRAEEERRHRVETVAVTWLSRQDRLMRIEQGEVREEEQPQRICQQHGDQPQKRRGKVTEGAAEAQRLTSKDSAAAAPRSIRVSHGRGYEARQAKSDVPGTPVKSSEDGGDGEKDTDEGSDVDAELEAAFAELEAGGDSPVDKKPLAGAVATTAPGQTAGEDYIDGATVPSATRVQGRGRGASGRGRGARSKSRNPRCGRGADQQGNKHPNKQLTPGADSSEELTAGVLGTCSKKRGRGRGRGRGASGQGGILPRTKPIPQSSGVSVDVPGMRPRKRLKGASTKIGLEPPAAEDSGSGFDRKAGQATRVGAEGSRMAFMAETKVGGVGAVSGVDELETDDVLGHLGIADAELIRQTQLALKAQREAMELLRRIRPPDPHLRLAAVEVATQQQPPPSVLALNLPGSMQPGMPGTEPAMSNAKANVGDLPGASRRRVATLPHLPPALAAPAQVGSGRQQQQKKKQPGAKSKAVGAAKKPSQPCRTRAQLDPGPGRQGENGALAGDTAKGTAGPVQSVGTTSPAAGSRPCRRATFAATVAASNHEAIHEAAGGGTGVLACDQSQPREGDAEGLGLLPKSGGTTSRGEAIHASQVAAGRANSALADDDEDVLAAFDAMFSAMKGLNALSSASAAK
ncbi:hypothetical protein VaNZ11_017093 [Volvox africanus]|uniref:Uncharacterized protein n=1 Tax=Volvox africanus TaxID=51714 RepID=A0ABQ5SQ30_9CHLO|nr:hypothetical protein VaNZ11_017093 [Volvox africanus]